MLVDRHVFVERLEEVILGLRKCRGSHDDACLRLHRERDRNVARGPRRIHVRAFGRRDVDDYGKMRALCGDLVGRVRDQRQMGAGDLRRGHVESVAQSNQHARDRIALLIGVFKEPRRDHTLVIDDERAWKGYPKSAFVGSTVVFSKPYRLIVAEPASESCENVMPRRPAKSGSPSALDERLERHQISLIPDHRSCIPARWSAPTWVDQNRSLNPPDVTRLWTAPRGPASHVGPTAEPQRAHVFVSYSPGFGVPSRRSFYSESHTLEPPRERHLTNRL